MFHPFEISAVKSDTMFTAVDPVCEAVSPFVGCDGCNFTLDGNNQVLQSPVVGSSESLLYPQKQKEVCRQ